MTDIKTRNNLAYMWSGFGMWILSYIIIKFGYKIEILTLMIGFISGVMTTILGVYFSNSMSKTSIPGIPGTATVSIDAEVTPGAQEKDETKETKTE